MPSKSFLKILFSIAMIISLQKSFATGTSSAKIIYEQFENDKYKEKCANDNNYSVIRIIQEDVLNDTYDWINKLCDAIEEIIKGDDVVNIYLCQNDEYKDFY